VRFNYSRYLFFWPRILIVSCMGVSLVFFFTTFRGGHFSRLNSVHKFTRSKMSPSTAFPNPPPPRVDPLLLQFRVAYFTTRWVREDPTVVCFASMLSINVFLIIIFVELLLSKSLSLGAHLTHASGLPLPEVRVLFQHPFLKAA